MVAALGASALAVPLIAFGGVAHADDAPRHDIACDHPCVLAFADSDGDGYSDAYELLVGSDPLDAASRPAERDTAHLIDEGTLARVQVSVGGPTLVTMAPGLFYVVDLTAQPDGTSVITSTLVDPLTGLAFSQNHYGIDAGSAGVDVKGLAEAFRNDPTMTYAGATDVKLPTDTPEMNRRNDPKFFSDDEGGDEGGDDPGAGTDDPPAAGPDDTGGGDDAIAGKQPKKWCNTGDDCPKEKEADPTPAPKTQPKSKDPKPPEKTWLEKGKCALTPGCTNMTDPDSTTGTDPTIDPSSPPNKILIAPEDPMRDGGTTIEAPTGPYVKGPSDPTVTDPNPDADPVIGTGTGTGQPKINIAPTDPPKGDVVGGGIVPGLPR
jgi:hypothetical protein